MKRFLACLGVFSIIVQYSPALAVEATPLSVSRLGDVELTCGQLSQEAALMRDIVLATQDVQDQSRMQGHGISAAGAIGSFLVGTVTGGVGFAAAGFIAKQATTEKKEEEAETIQDIAKQRRSLMLGIYNAKGCTGPVEHALQDPSNADPLLQIAGLEPASGEPEELRRNRRSPRTSILPPKQNYNP